LQPVAMLLQVLNTCLRRISRWITCSDFISDVLLLGWPFWTRQVIGATIENFMFNSPGK
jgi:hypothetical protein